MYEGAPPDPPPHWRPTSSFPPIVQAFMRPRYAPSSFTYRTLQIQALWVVGGRLRWCRLHSMKLIDSCKNRGTQSSAKETQECAARWAGAPALIAIFIQRGVWNMREQWNIIDVLQILYDKCAQAICWWEMRCTWTPFTHGNKEPGFGFLIGENLGDAHPNEEADSRCRNGFNLRESHWECDTHTCSICRSFDRYLHLEQLFSQKSEQK